jgi:hypothetical protein
LAGKNRRRQYSYLKIAAEGIKTQALAWLRQARFYGLFAVQTSKKCLKKCFDCDNILLVALPESLANCPFLNVPGRERSK